MTLKYSDKMQISRHMEVDAYRQAIIDILEDSKQLAIGCDNLVKLRALKTRCEKISRPRPTAESNDRVREYKRQKYHANKLESNKKLQIKRKKIREMGETDGCEILVRR